MKSMKVVLTATTVALTMAVGQLALAQTPTQGFSGFVGDEAAGQPAAYSSYVQDDSGAEEESPDPVPETTADDLQPVSEYLAPANSGAVLWDPWVSLDYVFAWSDGRRLPPLVSSGAAGSGALLPAGTVQFGGGDVGTDLQSGIRGQLGTWFDQSQRLGIGFGFFGLEGATETYTAADAAALIAAGSDVGRPFFNTDLPTGNASQILSGPGITLNTLDIVADNDVMTADAFFRYSLLHDGDRRVNFIAGYKFGRIDDSLEISHTGMGPGPNPTRFHDLFAAENTFHAAQLGFDWTRRYGAFSLSTMTKIAFGNMKQRLRVQGSSMIGAVNFAGGLLAQPTNIGSFENDEFVWAPETAINLTYHATQRIDLKLGYNFQMWSSVALAGDQVDTNINRTQFMGGGLVGSPDPRRPTFNDTKFWVQGLDVGLIIRY